MKLSWNNILMLSTIVFLMMTSFCLISLLRLNLCQTEKLSVFPSLRLAKSIRNSSTCMTIDKARLLWSLPTNRKLVEIFKIVLLTEFLNYIRETIMKNSKATKNHLERIQDLLTKEGTLDPLCAQVELAALDQEVTLWSAKEVDMLHLEERSQKWEREA